nr:hypothetical protein [Tanacetum cinerariifolium]
MKGLPNHHNADTRELWISTDIERGNDGDGGGDDRPPPYQVPTGCGGCLGNQGKGTRKPNLGGRRAGRQHTRQETRNIGLKAITDKSGPVPIRFKGVALALPFLAPNATERKARVVAKIGTQFDLRPHMESDRWPKIYAGIQQHLQKIYNGKKAALKQRYWVPEEDGSYDLEGIRRAPYTGKYDSWVVSPTRWKLVGEGIRGQRCCLVVAGGWQKWWGRVAGFWREAEVGDEQCQTHISDHAAHWANYLEELVRELPLHYPSWRQMPPERKAWVMAKIGTQIDLRPHMESDCWPQIYVGIQQHLQKIYNGKKATLTKRYWVPDEDETYDLNASDTDVPHTFSR